jgi:hypothetical protein
MGSEIKNAILVTIRTMSSPDSGDSNVAHCNPDPAVAQLEAMRLEQLKAIGVLWTIMGTLNGERYKVHVNQTIDKKIKTHVNRKKYKAYVVLIPEGERLDTTGRKRKKRDESALPRKWLLVPGLSVKKKLKMDAEDA